MNTYRSTGHHSVIAYNMEDAAEIFAKRKARKMFGSAAYLRTCKIQSWSHDNTFGVFFMFCEVSAFVGYSTGRNKTDGLNVNFTVHMVK